MTETTAKIVIDGENIVLADGALASDENYVRWWPGRTNITLDGKFTPEQLAAIAKHVAERSSHD